MSIVIRSLPAYFDINALVHLNRQRYPYALISSAYPVDSQAGRLNANVGQYDIVFACPQRSLQLGATGQLYYTDGDGERLPDEPVCDTFFAELARLCAQQKVAMYADNRQNLPFYGGWFVYLSYEMAAEVEPCLQLPQANAQLPLAIATRIPAAVIRDRINQQCYLVAEKTAAGVLDEIEKDCEQLLKPNKLSAISGNTSQPVNLSACPDALQSVTIKQLIEAEEVPYLAQLEQIKQYIYDGDIFQANLSRLWSAQIDQPVADVSLFNLLAEHNPASFGALVTFADAAIISSSPERLVSMRAGLIETRPIAGTRPRSADAVTDTRLAEELLAHPKEQAEHVMLIDLERNDLGRVCVPGSIHVDELMVLESWQHVHHIVSTVSGQCRADKSSVDVIKALFPGGTITGCPKVRCMEILAQQEQQPRGAYTGSVGYINLDGDMDFNILIRTLVREQDWVSFRAGGGIVADSVALHELAETRAKARGLLKIFSPDR